MTAPAKSNFIAPSFDNVPAELRQRDAWVLWRYETLRDGGYGKVPHNARRPSANASTTNPNTWSSFTEAVAAYEKSQGSKAPFTGKTGLAAG